MTTQFFSLGEPLPVLDSADILNYLESVLMFEKYYNPPVDFSSLAKAVKATAHHQSALSVKKNILMSTCQTSPLFPRAELEKFVQDFLVFGNAYLQRERNKALQIMRLNVPLAKYMRRGKEQGKYYLLTNDFNEFEFKQGEIFHLKQADINQEIYGLPDYLGALQSALLNESATLFRRKYYLNGAHAGSIIYMTDPMANETDVDVLKEQLKQAKGKGNFKNLFLYAPDGKENGIKVIPLSDVVAKDEFLNIKNTSRDDILAAHRVPPQLMGIIPNNTGGFGDIEKAGKVFFINEIKPLQQRLNEINEWVGQEVITFTPYELLAES
ncbi:phage portal protein [Ursidibacter sp. B-7004-1]